MTSMEVDDWCDSPGSSVDWKVRVLSVRTYGGVGVRRCSPPLLSLPYSITHARAFHTHTGDRHGRLPGRGGLPAHPDAGGGNPRKCHGAFLLLGSLLLVSLLRVSIHISPLFHTPPTHSPTHPSSDGQSPLSQPAPTTQLKRHYSLTNSKNPPVTTYDFQPRLASYHRQSDTELLKVRKERREGRWG